MSEMTDQKRAVMKQALEALEAVYGDSCDAIHALRFELAQQAEPVQEPYCHVYEPVEESPATLIDPRGSLGEPIV
jgi:hypothetical protein